MSSSDHVESRAASRKMLHGFLLLAGINIALVAFVMWPREKSLKNPAPVVRPPVITTFHKAAAPPTPQHEWDATAQAILGAYNARDAYTYAEQFTSDASPSIDEEYFRTVVISDWHERYGMLNHSKLLAAESVIEGDTATLYYTIDGSKSSARATLMLKRDGGTIKATRFELEPAK